MKAERNGIKVEGTPTEMKEFFGIKNSVACNTLGPRKGTKHISSSQTWTSEEDAIVKRLRKNKKSAKTIINKIKKDCGIKRTRPAVLSRCYLKKW